MLASVEHVLALARVRTDLDEAAGSPDLSHGRSCYIM